MDPIYIPRMVNLTQREYQIIKQVAEERTLGTRGFSTALRLIVREWADLTQRPAPQLQPADTR